MKKIVTITCFLCVALAMDAQIWLTQDKTLYFGNKTVADSYSLGRSGWWNMVNLRLLDWKHNAYNTPERFMIEMGDTTTSANISSTQPFVFGDTPYDTDIYAAVYTHGSSPSGPTAMASMNASGNNNVIATLRPVMTEADGRTVYTLDVASIEAACPDAVQTLPGGQKVYNYTKVLALVTAEAEALKQRVADQSEELALLKQSQTNTLYSENGTLHFSVPDGTQTAYVQLCNESGRQIRLVNVTGTGSLVLTDEDLPAGTGYASLLVDGSLAGTQRITLK